MFSFRCDLTEELLCKTRKTQKKILCEKLQKVDDNERCQRLFKKKMKIYFITRDETEGRKKIIIDQYLFGFLN